MTPARYVSAPLLTVREMIECVLDANGAAFTICTEPDGTITRKFQRRDILEAIECLQAEGLIADEPPS